MRRLIFMMSASLDGYMSGLHGELDWHQVDEELHTHFNEQLEGMGAFLDGRVSYELMADYWPTADADPEAERPIVEFARIWRDMPKLVYSRTLESAEWNSTVVREVIRAEVEELKAQSGGDLVLGGANLATSFRQLDLIDEYRVYVHPIVLGQGQPMFQPLEASTALRLMESKPFSNGVVLLRYARA